VLDGERPEDSIALATAGGSAALKASTRACSSLPELEFVVDRRPAALADFRVDQVDGEFMGASAGATSARGASRVRKRYC
jgi:hypothetical protein